ncbi:MAG TPA: DUF1289 domain-containing protein [Xanthobacteraceae bacterium]|nr:DUF1289 domain-containing protein [Xanthobacteraceae bacterium]
MPAVSSPCIRTCRIDTVSGLCIGCCRTIEEIGHWLSLSEHERLRIMAALPARRRRLEAARPRDAARAQETAR